MLENPGFYGILCLEKSMKGMIKMTKRELFVKAHKLTKEIVKETGVNYRTQFGICLSFLYKEEKEEVVAIETID